MTIRVHFRKEFVLIIEAQTNAEAIEAVRRLSEHEVTVLGGDPAWGRLEYGLAPGMNAEMIRCGVVDGRLVPIEDYRRLEGAR